MEKIDIAKRVRELNATSEAYYNSDQPIMSDYEFDCKLDELKRWEEETGIVLSNSPTQNVGYDVMSKLEKSTHSHPMLSLDKTKSIDDLVKFSNGRDCVISLKMDGLTVLTHMKKVHCRKVKLGVMVKSVKLLHIMQKCLITFLLIFHLIESLKLRVKQLSLKMILNA